MLPDYPETKKKLREVLMKHFFEKLREGLGPLADIPPQILFEGSNLVVERPRPRGRRARPMKKISAKVAVTPKEVAEMDLSSALQRVGDLARQVSEGQSDFTFRAIAEDLDEAGQSVNAGGQPLTPELFLEVLEKLAVDFDAAGRARFPTLMVGPAMAERAAAVLGQLQSNSAYQRRLHSILAKKKAEFDVREASRDLAG